MHELIEEYRKSEIERIETEENIIKCSIDNDYKKKLKDYKFTIPLYIVNKIIEKELNECLKLFNE